MGINPLGSNGKARTTLIFNRTVERDEFKHALSDIAAVRGASPSETALAVVLESVASEPETRAIARDLYATDSPRCQDALETIFQHLAADSAMGSRAKPLVSWFLDLALALGLGIDTAADDAILLRNAWGSVVEVLQGATVGRSEPARNASQLASALDYMDAAMSISPLLSCLLDGWKHLHSQSCTYRVLCALARMAFCTRSGAFETAHDRLALLRAADEFYEGGKEGSL